MSNGLTGRQNTLLQTYSVERHYNSVVFQVLVAIVTLLFTYLIAIASLASGKCAHVATFSWEGCSAIPAPLEWAAPAPVVALLAFLIAIQALLELGGIYIIELEHEIDALAAAESGEHLVVPQGLRHIVAEAFGRRPFGIAQFITYPLLYALALAFGVGSASLMPWHPGFERVTSIVVCIVYVGLMGTNIFMALAIYARRGRWRIPIHRGTQRRRLPWTLIYRDVTDKVQLDEAMSRRPEVSPAKGWHRPEPRAAALDDGSREGTRLALPDKSYEMSADTDSSDTVR
jgi:hypothetical protein